MEITLLIKSVLGLIFLLGVLIFLMLIPSRNKKKHQKQKTLKKHTAKTPAIDPMKTDLESLIKIIKDKKSDKHKLKEALELIIKYHGNIHKKLGLRAHPDFEIYKDILMTICRHPHTNKHLILYIDRNLAELNPDYKSNINDALTKGLNSRGL
ncbi:hypothetical protein SAMN06314042_11411 [Epsilonproteobacteria bacterium SCGC AD-308-O04]|jgi:hypothetical protein|nr:hypothetical protein SAMN06314042_11411 [Epsilonproteobacteria bacterium SCGC AD-308-O04]